MALSKNTSKATHAKASTRRKSKPREKQRPKVDWFPEELEAFKPPERYTVSEWADKYRVLTNISAEPGRWRTARTPYLKEPMDKFTSNTLTLSLKASRYVSERRLVRRKLSLI